MTSTEQANRQTVFVTGSSRGIGRGIVCALAEHGMNVGVHYVHHQQAAEEVKQQLEAHNVRVELFQGDLSQRKEVERLGEEVFDRFGRVDLVVNNAGRAPRKRDDILQTSHESWDEVLETNLTGPMFLSQALVTRMLQQPAIEGVRGRLVFITSISSYVASVNRVEYCVSKAGLSMVAKVFAVRLAREGIPTFDIQPGLTTTDMTAQATATYTKLIEQGLVPQGRWGTPADIAQVVLAIAEGRLDFCQGQILEPAGGFGLDRL